MANYGNSTTDAATIPDTVPANITDTSVGNHTWTESSKKKVLVSLLAATAGKMRVKFNGTATAANFDREVLPGGAIESPDGIRVLNVSIYSDGATITHGTDYVVQGWD